MPQPQPRIFPIEEMDREPPERYLPTVNKRKDNQESYKMYLLSTQGANNH